MQANDNFSGRAGAPQVRAGIKAGKLTPAAVAVCRNRRREMVWEEMACGIAASKGLLKEWKNFD